MGMGKGMGCSIKGQASERPSETINPQFLRYRNYSSTAALSTVNCTQRGPSVRCGVALEPRTEIPGQYKEAGTVHFAN